MSEPLYEVRVAGVVPETFLQELEAITAAPDQVSTVLYGLEDEAALYGLLARLRALGLEVLEVRRVMAPTGEPLEPPEPASAPTSEGKSGS